MPPPPPPPPPRARPRPQRRPLPTTLAELSLGSARLSVCSLCLLCLLCSLCLLCLVVGVAQVVVQLLDYAHNWAATILNDASANARMRVLGRAPNHALGMQWATQTEPPVEPQDVVLAVRGRTEHGFTQRAAREVIAQQAADVNAEPMPILPRRVGVLLPSDPAAIAPAGRRLMARGLDLDDEEEFDGPGFDAAPSHSWWALRTKPIRPPPDEFAEGVAENAPLKRQRPL